MAVSSEHSETKGFDEENIHISGMDMCRAVFGWPEDELAHWVASHRDDVKRMVCTSPQHRDESFCQTD